MRIPITLRRLAATFILSAPLLLVSAKKDQPSVKKTEFSNMPSNYFYFDDSSVILSFDDVKNVVWRSEDDGASWDKVKGVPDKKAMEIHEHPFDRKRAYILGSGKTHWKTDDRGKTWTEWEVDALKSFMQPPFSFHAEKHDYVLFNGRKCDSGSDRWDSDCEETTYYTKDNFDKKPEVLLKKTHGCLFARSTKLFNKGTPYTIFCVIEGTNSHRPEHRRIVNSDDWFRKEDGDTLLEPKLDGTRTYEGIAGVAVVQKFIVVAVKSSGTDEMALFISDDSTTFKRAQFPHDHGGVHEDAYTVLESTPYSVQVDVLTTKPGQRNAVGSLFTSNSDGTQFTRSLDDTNRSPFGLVDFEKIQGIDGIVLANQVKNAKEVKGDKFAEKKIVSRISFDDGRTWQPLKADGEELHLHSVTNMHNGGRVFSSPAPGLVMGVGNTGDHLLGYNDGDLYVSDDAGLTWKKARKEAHKYEFGDAGSILVAVYDEDVTGKIAYSLNHGKDWSELELGVKIRAKLLTTTPDSTSAKFTLVGTGSHDNKGKTFIFCIDFTDMHERKCKMDKSGKGDYEKWYARLDKDGKPDCIMGHKQFYWRRKKDADCFVDEVYKDPEVEEEVCECTEEDFECDFDFEKDDSKGCKPAPNYKIPDGKCKKPSDTYTGRSGFRKIPGNTCKGGKDLTKEVEHKCDEGGSRAPTDGKIKARPKVFDGTRKIIEFYYLQRTDSDEGDDETVVMRTTEDEVWISRDGGGKWEQILKGESIVAIYPHKHFPSVVFFITPSKTVHYSTNRGKDLHKFEAPTKPNKLNLPIMDFHPKKKDYWIWTGAKNCELFSPDCHVVTYHTNDRGDSWNTLLSRVRKCEWVPRDNLENLIFCERYQKGDGSKGDKLELVASKNFFQDSTTHFKDIIGFATMQEFIIVAAVREDGKSLKVDASVDGQRFADAKFPPNFQIDHQQAYTVLESNTHSVFLHVTVNTRFDREYGSLIKSNSNGTLYVMSLNGVNRNRDGYVDFEKMQGLEGVAIVNVVDNMEDAANGAQKKLRSMITHNDAGQWAPLKAPEKDVDGKAYSCKGDKCSLNLHGYTERKDPRDTFSSGSAVGLMMGVGNVGEHLTAKNDGDTFLTRDGGITWKEIKKGNYMWEYGDQGSIIVIVEEFRETNKIFYTLDEGAKWEEFQFYDEKITVEDITTVPSDTSRKFILWCKPKGHGEKYVAVQIDFTGLTDTQCKQSDKSDSDFEVWIPKHPLQDNNCLFGHEERFYRKKPDHHCYIGKKVPKPLDGKGKFNNCTCQRQDYECDFNYQPTKDGRCELVPGLSPPDHSEACKNDPNLIEWFKPTGYRRIPLTTCEGGHELDKVDSEPCPGKEPAYKKKHGGMSGAAIFFLTVGVFGMAGAIGYIIWNRWQGKFGQIRLGDDPRQGGASKIADTAMEYGVLVVSAVVAVVAALPSIVVALYGATIGRFFQRRPRFTTRGSFARGDYSAVTSDEGELLGDESDEEV